MFTRTRTFGTYRTIVLGNQQPSIEKIAPLVFHSTTLTTDGSRLFFLVVVRKKFPRDMNFPYLSKESLQQLSFEKMVNSFLRSVTLRADARRLLHG